MSTFFQILVSTYHCLLKRARDPWRMAEGLISQQEMCKVDLEHFIKSGSKDVLKNGWRYDKRTQKPA
jgi:hypothetical protein